MKRIILFFGLVLLFAGVGRADTYQTSIPSDFLAQFEAAVTGWLARITPFADSVFYLLAVCDLMYTGAILVLEGVDFHAWSVGLVRTFLRIGFFLTLLRYGADWIPAIINSFAQLGKSAAGVSSLQPSAVFAEGLQIASNLYSQASSQGFLIIQGTSILIILCCLVIVIAFAMMTLSLIMTWVEAYLCMSVAFILLGFGGSRWTQEYATRVLSMAISIGIRLLVVYVIIATGQALTGGWADQASKINSSAMPAMDVLSIMAACLLLSLCAWHLPKLASTALGYGPALGHGEVIGMTAAALTFGARAGSLVAGGGSGAAMSAATGSSSGSTVTAQVANVKAPSATVEPPTVRMNGKG